VDIPAAGQDVLADSTLAAIVRQSTVGFFAMEIGGRFTAVNDAFCELAGYSRDELLLMRPEDLDVPGDTAIAAQTRSLLASGELTSWRRRRPAIRKDGSVVWIDLSGFPVRDATGSIRLLGGFVVDITSEVVGVGGFAPAESGTGDQYPAGDRDLIARAVHGGPIGQAVMTLTGEFVEANLAFCAITGHSRVQLVGRAAAAITHPDDVHLSRQFMPQLVSGEIDSFTIDMRYVMADGDRRGAGWGIVWGRSFYSAVRGADGRPAWIVSQLIDITAEREAKDRAASAEADLRFRSEHDPLTGTFNRDRLMRELQAALADAEHTDHEVGVLLLDMDQFKEINDGISHAAGDAVLAAVTERLRAAKRSTDEIGRLGGDEFVIVSRRVTNADQAIALADRVVAAIDSMSYDIDGTDVWASASVGIAVSGPTHHADKLLQEADTALHEAKRNGRDRWELFDERLRGLTGRRMLLAERIRGAIQHDEFRLFYQPQIDLESRRIVGYEALLRWPQSDGSVVDAEQFIEVAEARGLVTPIGEQLIAAAVGQARTLPPHQRVSINASPPEIAAPGFAERICAELARSGVPAGQLAIEITERSLLENVGPTRAALRTLADLGVAIHVDDFGTGYSSLTHLRDFPVSGVKLDRSFTHQLTHPDFGQVTGIVAGIADLADRLGLERIAEGVESVEQELLLRELGWDRAQGFLYSAATATVSGEIADESSRNP
jgi:diguanylate cyclase (GGDEF)-like protein/PAS domain S-box-containing protein